MSPRTAVSNRLAGASSDGVAADRGASAGNGQRPRTGTGTGELEDRLAETLRLADDALDHRSGGNGSRPDSADTRQVVADVLERLVGAIHRPSRELKRARLIQLCELALELRSLQHELDTRRLGQSLQALDSVQTALSRLRGIDSPAAMIEKGLAVLCEDCDFDRAILFGLPDSKLVAEAAFFAEDTEWAQEFVAFSRSRPVPMNLHGYPESEMFRRRTPVLVEDSQTNPATFKPLVKPLKTQSYVAAPLIPAGKVIGFLHADAYYAGRRMTPLDRDTLWAFAEGFGYALQRTLLVERLRAQRDQVRQMVVSTEAVVNELTDAEVELLQADDEGATMTRTAAAVFVAPEARLDTLLTRREREVLGLVAEGETNAAIADRLVISELTVKSHVKHILRKLRAANRAEAVSRYMRLRGEASRQA